MNKKADYVRSAARQEGHTGPHKPAHTCHWPGCGKAIPPAMWGCKPHWFRLPVALRNRIWRTYQPGQEITKTPSREYIDAAHAVQAWIREHEVERVVSGNTYQPRGNDHE